jgi:hypothetical protein
MDLECGFDAAKIQAFYGYSEGIFLFSRTVISSLFVALVQGHNVHDEPQKTRRIYSLLVVILQLIRHSLPYGGDTPIIGVPCIYKAFDKHTQRTVNSLHLSYVCVLRFAVPSVRHPYTIPLISLYPYPLFPYLGNPHFR